MGGGGSWMTKPFAWSCPTHSLGKSAAALEGYWHAFPIAKYFPIILNIICLVATATPVKSILMLTCVAATFYIYKSCFAPWIGRSWGEALDLESVAENDQYARFPRGGFAGLRWVVIQGHCSSEKVLDSLPGEEEASWIDWLHGIWLCFEENWSYLSLQYIHFSKLYL